MGELARSKIDKWLEKDNLMLLTCWARDGYKDAQIAEALANGTYFGSFSYPVAEQ